MRARVLRPRGVRKASRVNDALRCCLPPWGTASALRSKRLSRLNGRPARAPVNAPAMPLRTPQYDSGSVWFAIPSPYGSLIHYSSPAYRRFPPTHSGGDLAPAVPGRYPPEWMGHPRHPLPRWTHPSPCDYPGCETADSLRGQVGPGLSSSRCSRVRSVRRANLLRRSCSASSGDWRSTE